MENMFSTCTSFRKYSNEKHRKQLVYFDHNVNSLCSHHQATSVFLSTEVI